MLEHFTNFSTMLQTITWIFTVLILLSNTRSTLSSSPLDCDFEQDDCQWQVSDASDEAWVRTQAPSNNPRTGPVSDHTYGNSTGWYLVSENITGTTILESKIPLKENQTNCLSFWLYMNGPYDQTFQVKAGDKIVIDKSGDQGDIWRNIIVELRPLDQPKGIQFITYEATNNKSNHVAIDDITVRDGKCPKAVGPSCDFEQAACGWYPAFGNKSFHVGRFRADQMTGGIKQDHTIKYGYYVSVNASKGHVGQMVGLRSAELTGEGPVCLRFYYFMSLEGDNVLTVAIQNNIAQHLKPVWKPRESRRGIWTKGEVTLKSPLHSQILMYFTIGGKETGILGLDDITFSKGQCLFRGNYGFEQGLGMFYNDNTNDFDWVAVSEQESNYTWLPANDATLSNIYGHFAVAYTNRTSKGKRATMWSPVFTRHEGRCMTFYLFIHGSDPGTMTVEMVSYSGQPNITVWSYTPHHKEEFYEHVRFPVIYSDHFQMKFTVVLGADAGWAIDEITTHHTTDTCTVKPIAAQTVTTPSPSTTTTTSTATPSTTTTPTTTTPATTTAKTTTTARITTTTSTTTTVASTSTTTKKPPTPKPGRVTIPVIRKSTTTAQVSPDVTTLPSTMTPSSTRASTSSSTKSNGGKGGTRQRQTGNTDDGKNDWILPVAAVGGVVVIAVIIVSAVVYRKRSGNAEYQKRKERMSDYSENDDFATANPIYGQLPASGTVDVDVKGSNVRYSNQAATAFENPMCPTDNGASDQSPTGVFIESRGQSDL